MVYSMLVFVHVFAAVIGLLSGYLSMAFRKGSGLHRAAGVVFAVAMLAMSSSAVYISAFLRPVAINVVAGLLTFYLVTTGWRAGRRKGEGSSVFDLGALVLALAIGAGAVSLGFEAAGSAKGSKDGVPAAVYFVFGATALLCSVSDVRSLVRGTLAGAERVARHLWRMSLALLIASLSFYPGQARLFPKALRETNLLFIPHVLLAGAMLFWLVRVRARGRRQKDEKAPRARPSVAALGGVSGA
jgi:uncharacterized membrane protein